ISASADGAPSDPADGRKNADQKRSRSGRDWIDEARGNDPRYRQALWPEAGRSQSRSRNTEADVIAPGDARCGIARALPPIANDTPPKNEKADASVVKPNCTPPSTRNRGATT